MKTDTPKTIGRYQVLGLLGRGGMGVVYRARDLTIDRPVAIKILGVDQDGLRERFLQEARSAGKLHHPNIVTIYEYGDHEGDPFIAMEFVDGPNLAQVIAARGRLDMPTAMYYMREVAAALEYAHNHGVIHRDIKPANIIVTGAGLKILDFGIARMSDSSLTLSGATIGTPNYMSPEQVSCRPVDRRSDIFAVGLVFYEMLSGVQAFPGKANHPVMHAVAHETPVSLSDILPELDPAVVALINRAIEKEPDRRFSSLAEMLVELDRIDAGRYRAAAPLGGASGKTGGGLRQEVIARKRADAIEHHYQLATRLFQEGKFAESIEACEQAALFDSTEPRILDLLDQVRDAFDALQAAWLDAARAFLEEEDTEHASELVDRVLERNPHSIDALTIQASVDEVRRRRQSTNIAMVSTGGALSAISAEWPADPPTTPIFRDAISNPSVDSTESQAHSTRSQADPTESEAETTPDQAERVAPQDLMAGRVWLLVPPDLLPERDRIFKPRPPRPKLGPAVFHDFTPRAGDREWFGDDPHDPAGKSRGRVSVGVSLVLHGLAALIAAAILTRSVAPVTKPLVRMVAIVPPPLEVPPPPAPAPVPIRQPRVSNRPTVEKPAPVQAAEPQKPQPTPVADPEPTTAPLPAMRPDLVVTSMMPVPTNAVIPLQGPPPPGNPTTIEETIVTDFDTPPQLLQKVQPKIPVGASGIVEVRVVISSTGKVVRAAVLTPHPYQDLVLTAAYATTFRPARARGRAVRVEYTLAFNLATIKCC